MSSELAEEIVKKRNKKAGNACRTKNQIRGSKSKGSQFEYNVQASLLPKYPTIYLTKQLGFQRQFDVCSDDDKIAIECKKERNTTWNQAKKYLDKLISVTSSEYQRILIYRCNNMPIMVMWRDIQGTYLQTEFELYFGVPFIKHKSTRVSITSPL